MIIMDQIELDNLIADLKEDEFKQIGEYTRIYPDAPDCSVDGIYAINIKHRVYVHDGSFAGMTFDVFAIDQYLDEEGEIHDSWLDSDHVSFWINDSESEESFWKQVREYLDKSKDLAGFVRYVESAFGFEKTKHLWVNAYHMVKDDLPDGEDFESFCNSLNI